MNSMSNNEILKEGFSAIVIAIVVAGVIVLLAYKPARNIYSLVSGLLAIISLCFFLYGIVKSIK